jgi:hypothetical protein
MKTEIKQGVTVNITRFPLDGHTFVCTDHPFHTDIGRLLTAGQGVPGSTVIDVDTNIQYKIEKDYTTDVIKANIEDNLKVGTNYEYADVLDIPEAVRWDGLKVVDTVGLGLYEFKGGITDSYINRRFEGKSVIDSPSAAKTIDINFNVISVTTGATDKIMTIPSGGGYVNEPYTFQKADDGAGDVVINDSTATTLATLKAKYDKITITNSAASNADTENLIVV